MQTKQKAVLFDLDGTLADSAPDLAAAANKMRCARGMEMLPFEPLRRVASDGMAQLIATALGIDAQHRDFPLMRQEFLENYAADVCTHTVLFPGIENLLTMLLSYSVPWGIVTNKIAQFAEPLIAQLNLHRLALLCLVSGDTTPYSKPHPAPLLYAANQLNIEPSNVVYVGDHLRDIQAGQSAGMLTIAAAYGYCNNSHPPVTEWRADYIAHSPKELHTLLLELVGTSPSIRRLTSDINQPN